MIAGVRQNRGGLGIGVVNNMLGIQLGVVDQCFGLSLSRGTDGGRVLLGAFQQFGTRLFGGGKHLLGVRSQGSEAVAFRLLVLLFLKLGLQLQNTVVIRRNLLTHAGQRLLRTLHTLLSSVEGSINLLLVISSQHHRETIHHRCLFLSHTHKALGTSLKHCSASHQR